MTLNINTIEKKLDYKFNDPKLLELALTHKSYSKDNNERLEFLGDSVVNLIFADILYNDYPKLDEGNLTLSRAYFINGNILAKMAKGLELDKFAILSSNEAKNLGRDRKSILANIFEAIVAAIYLDCNSYKKCKSIVQKWYEDNVTLDFQPSHIKDSKSKLQEYTQSKSWPLPEYKIIKISGKPHDQVFTIMCKIKTRDNETIGTGKTHKEAEQVAADQMMDLIEREANE